jgi:phage baseplate assembly protein W
MKNGKSFLGRGWSFPPIFNKELGSVELVSEIEDIRQSLHIYLSTRRGERLMRLDYGSFIHENIYDPAGANNLSFLAEQLRIDIRRYEPRIIVHEVEIDDANIAQGVIQFKINFEVQANNVRDNIVFPYYILEGTHI